VKAFRSKRVLALVATAIAVMFAGACGGDDDDGGGGGGQGGSVNTEALTVAVAASPDGLDPDNFFSIFMNQASHSIYETLGKMKTTTDESGLVVPDLESPAVEPNLAESWELSEDGRTLTVKLRQGVMSPAGNEMTSKDLQYWWDRAWAGAGEGKFQIGTILGIKKPSWRVVDDYTWEVKLPKFNSVLEYELAMAKFGIVPDSTEFKKHATDDDPWSLKWAAKNAAGFGPYQLESYKPGQQTVLTRFDGYWGEKATFESVVLREVPSGSNRAALVRTGDVDVAMDVPPRNLSQLDKDSAVKVYSTPGNVVSRLDFNLETPPFDNQKFRQALLHASPVEDIRESVFFGFASELKSPAPATFDAYDDSAWNYDYDLDKARQLLEESGVGNASFRLSYDNSSDAQREAMTILKSAWEEIGLEVELNGQPASSYFNQVTLGKLENFVQENFPINPDVGYGLGIAWPSNAPFNNTKYNNPKVDRLIYGGLATQDVEQRLDMYREAQREIVGDAAEIWLSMPGFHLVANPGLDGLNWNMDNAVAWSAVKPKQ
jgi:peptide/nickel transport system substrate-binding protein